MCKCHENPFLIKLQGSEPEPEKVVRLHHTEIFRSWDEDPKPPAMSGANTEDLCQDGRRYLKVKEFIYVYPTLPWPLNWILGIPWHTLFLKKIRLQ